MIIKVICIGIIATLLAMLLKKQSPEYAFIIAIATGVIIFALFIGDIKAIVETIKSASQKANMPAQYIEIMLKIIGIAYLTQFASSLAKDAGESSIANKIDFAGKITIIMISTPLFFSLLNIITGLLP